MLGQLNAARAKRTLQIHGMSRAPAGNHRSFATSRPSFVDLEQDDEDAVSEVGESNFDNVNDFIDLTEEDDIQATDNGNGSLVKIESDAPQPRRGPQANLRNGPLTSPWREIDEVEFGTSSLKAGKSVQLLQDNETSRNTKFLFIHHILRHDLTGEVRLRGHLLHRNTNLAMIPCNRLNELHIVIEEDLDDGRHYYVQGMVEVPLDHASKIRRITFSHGAVPGKRNGGYPGWRSNWFLDVNTMSKEEYDAQEAKIAAEGELVCRWLHIKSFDTGTDRKAWHTADSGHRYRKISQGLIRRMWADETPLKPRDDPAKKPARSVPQKQAPLHRGPVKPKQYTYGTGFCGCGGDALGAKAAGAKVMYGWDMWDEAITTFKLNHPRATAFIKSAFDMCDKKLSIPYADIVHLSCPCQYFSYAKVYESKMDDENIAAMMVTDYYLKKTKPRMHTQEQTGNIVNGHPWFFSKLFHMILSSGHNIRWGKRNFNQMGLSSSRPRLMIIAPRVGEAIPKLPALTHGRGLHPLTTINEVIRRVPDDEWHIPSAKPYDVPRQPVDGDRTQVPCITCSGSVQHPNGRRQLSVREIAAVTGFGPDLKLPSRNTMTKTKVRQQIGNAVPPMIWEQVIGNIIQTMKDFDDGTIDEAGMPIPRARPAQSMNDAATRMRDLSIEPQHSNDEPRYPNNWRERSETLTSGPPTPDDIWGDSLHPANEKKRKYVDLCDSDSEAENRRAMGRPRVRRKKQKKEAFVDLTLDD